MKTSPYIVLLVGLLAGSSGSFGAFAQQDSVYLWPRGEAPFRNPEMSESREMWQINFGVPVVKQISQPLIHVFLPPKDKANGTAVLICPGGGYTVLAMKHEGSDVARWFNSIGVAAFVLKHRLPDERIVLGGMKHQVPLSDAQQAMRLIRTRASEWGINPARVGVLGFSAGGHLASTLGTHPSIDNPTDSLANRQVLPNFMVLLYPVISMRKDTGHAGSRETLLGKNAGLEKIADYSNENRVNKFTPPTFLVHCSDDPVVSVQNSIVFYSALHQLNIPAEMHLYEKGGHGFGLGKSGAVSTWINRCAEWMKSRGLLR